MSYSEQTARELSRYVRKLVKRQPNWLRNLFDTDEICFVVEDNGLIQVACKESLEKGTASHALRLIVKYMEKYPSPVLGVLNIQ